MIQNITVLHYLTKTEGKQSIKAINISIMINFDYNKIRFYL